MMNEVKERMRLFPAIDKDGYKRLERLIDLNKGKLSEIEQGRLKAELNVIRETNTADLFLFALECSKNLNGKIYFRGALNNSYLAFILGITRVDALSYNLPFERFLCACKKQIPPLTMVVNQGEKGKLINALYETYGWERIGRCKDDENSFAISKKMLGEYCRGAEIKLHVSVGKTVWREQILPLTVREAEHNHLYVFEILEGNVSENYHCPTERDLYEFALKWFRNRNMEYSIEPYSGLLDLRKILGDTNHKCLYQEQFMRICIETLGVDGTTAEQWRKDICIRRPKKMQEIKETFENKLGDGGVKLYEYLSRNAIYMVAKGYLIGELMNEPNGY